MSIRKIYLIAGEVSGDRLGANLMCALRERFGADGVEFFGVGGVEMESQGLRSLFPMGELSLMGLLEVLPRLPRLLGLANRVVADIKEHEVDMLITVDIPDFSLRVAKKLSKDTTFRQPIKVHYGAPSVWAWRRGRAKDFARVYDYMLCLLPFEPRYFESEGLPSYFVGHSLWEHVRDSDSEASFRARHGIKDSERLLLVLGGSRESEITRLMPIFTETISLLRQQSKAMANLRVVALTLPHLRARIHKFVGDDVLILTDEADKYPAFASADVALAASGTVALELARANTPFIIGYKTNWLTAILMRMMIRVAYVSLPNILADRFLVGEFLQQQCRADFLADALGGLLVKRDDETIALTRHQVEKLRAPMEANKVQTPSHYAAGMLYELLQ